MGFKTNYNVVLVSCYKDIFPVFLILVCFNKTGLWSTACFSFHTCAATADFSIFQFFSISKVFFTRSSNQNQSVMGWQWGNIPWKHSPYIQVSDLLCYKPIPIIYITSLLQNSLKVIKSPRV